MLIETTSGNATNITAEAALGAEYVADADRIVHVDFRLSGLTATTANVTAVVRHKSAAGVQLRAEQPDDGTTALFIGTSGFSKAIDVQGQVPSTLGALFGTFTGNIVGSVGTVNTLANGAIAETAVADGALTAAKFAAGAIPTATENAAALLDSANGIETGRTLRKVLRILFAAVAGVSADNGRTLKAGGTGHKTRIADKNRTALTLDAD